MPFVSQQSLCHEIFGLPFPPVLEELQEQYRKLVKVLHPDKGGDKNEFIHMKDAYEVLKPIAETTKTGQSIGLIQGIPWQDFGHGYSPPMPKCTECNGVGYHRNVLKVLETYHDCPDCAPRGYKGFCARCKGKRSIKRVNPVRMNLICQTCAGKGQIYVSNPVLRVNEVV